MSDTSGPVTDDHQAGIGDKTNRLSDHLNVLVRKKSGNAEEISWFQAGNLLLGAIW